MEYLSDIEYESDSEFDLNSNMEIEDTYDYGKSMLIDIFESSYSDVPKLKLKNCLYLALNIYNNVITNQFENFDEINLLNYEINSSKLVFALKVGSSNTNNSNVYKRLSTEFDNNESLLYSIPIMILSGDNVRKIESDIHESMKNKKLKILMKKKNNIYKPIELYEMSEENKDDIYNYGLSSGLTCIYDVNLQKNQSWFDKIPKEIENILSGMFPYKELELLEVNDNLSKNVITHLNKNLLIK
jgi:hypothetical protein